MDYYQLATLALHRRSEFGQTKSINLIPNGSNIAVTRENRLRYIYLVANYRLTRQIKRQSDAFFEGLSDIIDPKWLGCVHINPLSRNINF